MNVVSYDLENLSDRLGDCLEREQLVCPHREETDVPEEQDGLNDQSDEQRNQRPHTGRVIDT